jgi:hypothetical protein
MRTGSTAAVAAAATAMLVGTALFWTVAGPAGAEGDAADSEAVLVKRVRLVDEGRTKLVEWVDETGHVEYCAAVDPRSKVTVTEDGEHEISIQPYDPGTDAAVKRMARTFTPEVMHSRTTACLPDDEE